MTGIDIVERLRDPSVFVKREDVADEIERLRREITTLRNFLGSIKMDVDMALGNYGQPTGEIDSLGEEMRAIGASPVKVTP